MWSLNHCTSMTTLFKFTNVDSLFFTNQICTSTKKKTKVTSIEEISTSLLEKKFKNLAQSEIEDITYEHAFKKIKSWSEKNSNQRYKNKTRICLN